MLRIAKRLNTLRSLDLTPENDPMASNLDTPSRFRRIRLWGATWSAPLAKRDYRIRSRCGGRNWPTLQPLGKVGQITPCRPICAPASVGRYARFPRRHHLVGILAESGAQRFDAVQGAGAGAGPRPPPPSARGGSRLRHRRRRESPAAMAALQARRKGGAAAVPTATILRPSVVFGPEINSPTARPPGQDVAVLRCRRRPHQTAAVIRHVATAGPTPSTARPGRAPTSSAARSADHARDHRNHLATIERKPMLGRGRLSSPPPGDVLHSRRAVKLTPDSGRCVGQCGPDTAKAAGLTLRAGIGAGFAGSDRPHILALRAADSSESV